MVLHTERLTLRPWEEADAESLYEYAKDPDVGPIAGWPVHTDAKMSLEIIRTVFAVPECYAICEKGRDKAIGSIALKLNGSTDMTERDDECELGYWLGKPFWGRGYMPEAAEELLRRAFEELGMTTVWCGYYDGNLKSRSVQYKLGFRYHHTCDEVEVPLLNEVRIGHTNYLTKNLWEVYQKGGYMMLERMPDLERNEIKAQAKFLEEAGFRIEDEEWGIYYLRDDMRIGLYYDNHGDPTDIGIKFLQTNTHFSVSRLMKKKDGNIIRTRSSFLKIKKLLQYLEANFEDFTDDKVCDAVMKRY